LIKPDAAKAGARPRASQQESKSTTQLPFPISAERFSSGASRSVRTLLGTPSQIFIALRQIEHQPSRTLVMRPLGMRAKLSRPLAQIKRIDQRVVWHGKQTIPAWNRSTVDCHDDMLARTGAATISEGGFGGGFARSANCYPEF
jgi:hypothetical protein